MSAIRDDIATRWLVSRRSCSLGGPLCREQPSNGNAAAFPTGTNGTCRRFSRPTRRGERQRTSWPASCRRSAPSRAPWARRRRSWPTRSNSTSRLSKDFSRLYVYASMMSDQDTRVSTYQGMQQEMAQIGATFGAETSFVEPEILKIDPSKIDSFIASEPRLKVYSFYLHDILRRRAHTLSDSRGENPGELLGRRERALGHVRHLSDADFPYPTVTLSDGKSVKLDSAGFNLYRAVPKSRRSREGHVGVLRLRSARFAPHSAPR